MGQHTNDLFTNQNYVGSPASETYNEQIINLQFYDREGNIIIPTKIKMRNTKEGGPGYDITSRTTAHNLGQINARANFGGRFTIENGHLIITGATNNEYEITEVYSFELLSLETEDKKYYKFLYK